MDFSRVAPLYQWIEQLVFGNSLQTRRRAFLQNVKAAENVLILGDGDGRFAVECLRLNRAKVPKVKFDLVEGSPGMVRQALRRFQLSNVPREDLRIQIRDVRVALLQGPYDLVISHFFLDCFSTQELRVLVPRVLASTSPDVRWIISEFAVPQQWFLRIGGKLLIKVMYLFFRVVADLSVSRLPDYHLVLRESGLRLEKHEDAIGGLLVSELWSKSTR